MKYINVLLFVLILIDTTFAQNIGSCSFTDDEINWDTVTFTNDPIRDDERLDKRFTFSGSLAVVNVSGPGAVYIDVTIDDETNELVFQTNHNFTYFDEDHSKQDSTITLALRVELFCDNSLISFTFVQDVEDTNNHQPIFSENVFRFETPSVLDVGTILSSFGDNVIAEDIDFSNQNITFKIYPSDVFTVRTVILDFSKYYLAHIIVANATIFEEATVFTIHATDDQEPYLHSTAFLVITPTTLT